MKSVLVTGIVCGAVLASVASLASAGPVSSCTGVCDNTQAGDVNEINGALFVTNDAKGSVGTGTFPSFVKVHDGSSKTVEDGYNTFASGGPFLDTKNAPLRMPTVANLAEVGWNGTLVVGGTGYYQFNLDINEEKNVADKWLSLDQVEVCLSTSNSLAPANTSLWSGCSGLGASRVYAMDLGGDTDPDNTVLMDFSINEGSGNGIDLFLLIPVGSFSSIVGPAGNPADYYIYLYSHFGKYGLDETRIVETKRTGNPNDPTITNIYADFGQSDGGEEWAYRACPPDATGCTPPPPPPCAQGEICTTSVPSPGSLALLGAGLLGLAGARRVRRTLVV